MAKIILISLITYYQKYISPTYKSMFGIKSACRYNPTCYDYSMKIIKKNGAFKGLVYTIKRVLTCNPYSKQAANI